MRNLGHAIFAIISLVLLSCNTNKQTEENNQEFKTLTIKTQDVSLTRSYSASIRGRQDIKIVPRVDGYLTDILIKEGQRVRKGQTLFIIDQVAYKAALESAKASVALSEAGVATAELTRNSKKALYEKNVVSEYDYTFAENALKTAKAQLQQAKSQEVVSRNNLSFTVIQSPSDGVAGKIPFRQGDYVNPNIQEGLTVVADNSEMYIYFSMAERELMELLQKYENMSNAIAKMPDVKLQLSDGSIYEHSGRIESISGLIDASTGSASIRAMFPNKNGLLLSGGAGSVIMPYRHTDAIVIPQEATFEIQDKTYVYKVIEGVTESAIISVDKINNGKEFIVTEGLQTGDVIIAEGAGLIQEGAKVASANN